MRKFQNQVHRRAAEIAEGYFFVIQSWEAIGSQTSCLWQSIKVAFNGSVTPRELCSDPTEGFLFGGLSPPNKKIAFSVSSPTGENLIWTSMIQNCKISSWMRSQMVRNKISLPFKWTVVLRFLLITIHLFGWYFSIKPWKERGIIGWDNSLYFTSMGRDFLPRSITKSISDPDFDRQ